MARDLTTGAQIQLVSHFVRPLLLVSLAFADRTEYLHTALGTIAWNSQSWIGVGTLGQISAVGEGGGVLAQGITLTLSGVDPAMLTEALGEVTGGGEATVYLGFLDVNGVLVPDPIPLFAGVMDEPQIKLSTETCTISISVENKLADLNRARGGRYTDQDQRRRFPLDGGLQWVGYLMDQRINWK